MGLRIYNTLTGKKEDFTPIVPGRVNIYVCGVTVYDYCHMGHARSMIVFDVIVKYLRYLGYKVTYVRNFTDIDDKIIKRAKERGKDPKEIAQYFTKAFYEDMDSLGVERADIEPRATEHIPEMVSLIERIINKGYAYVVDGNVYFSVRRFKGYGGLSKRSLEEMMAGARVEVDPRKEHPLDFALWKKAKPGEPFWESPWGKGRPGWHIECSAMSMKYLGETFDIHGGGQDLIFPHHENEKAQSEAATDKPFVNYWIHHGFLTINQEKMSKSLKNFFTIREILSKFHPEAIRLFFLNHHYRSPVDFSDEKIKEATKALEKLYITLDRAKQILGEFRQERPDEAIRSKPLYKRLIELEGSFRSAMDDDFNTAKAIACLFDAIKEINLYLDKDEKEKGLIFEAVNKVKTLGNILGILRLEPRAFLTQGIDISVEEIEKLIAERAIARKRRDFKKADSIRERLAQSGIILEDTPHGTTWRVDYKRNL